MKDRKISKPGLVYAKDYQLLEIARDEFHEFLSEIENNVKDALSEIVAQARRDLKGNYEIKKSSRSIYWTRYYSFYSAKDTELLDKGEDLLTLGYGDVTVVNSNDDPLSVWVSVELKKSFSKKLAKLDLSNSTEVYSESYKVDPDDPLHPFNRDVTLDISSTIKSTEKIAEEIGLAIEIIKNLLINVQNLGNRAG